jgi:hypothetical protein
MTHTQPRKNGKITGTGKGGPPVETRFKPGNPGRPKGSPNKATAFLAGLTDGDVEAIVKAIIAKARKGDLAAARLVLDRIAPAPRARAVEIDLPEVGQYDGRKAILSGYTAIIEGVSAGRIAPTEALELSELLDKQRQAIADLAPARPDRKPTPAEIEANKRNAEWLQQWSDRLNGSARSSAR